MNTSAGFASLERANPKQLSKFFLGEHPQTTALDSGAPAARRCAAQLLEQLPDDMRADVLLRMASLGEIPPDVIARISSVIDQRLRGLGGKSSEQRGGVRAVAELFNCLDRGVRSPALDTTRGDGARHGDGDSQSDVRVRGPRSTSRKPAFARLSTAPTRRCLTLALKGASEAIRDRFFANMSKRAVDLMKEEMEMLGRRPAARGREGASGHRGDCAQARRRRARSRRAREPESRMSPSARRLASSVSTHRFAWQGDVVAVVEAPSAAAPVRARARGPSRSRPRCATCRRRPPSGCRRSGARGIHQGIRAGRTRGREGRRSRLEATLQRLALDDRRNRLVARRRHASSRA